jgi:hypothetical protein
MRYEDIPKCFLGINHFLEKWTLKWAIKLRDFFEYTFRRTVDPVYSELGYSEYPVIVNGFLFTDR